MSIFTRFGTPVRILGREARPILKEGPIWIEVEQTDGKQKEVLLSDLRADGGMEEINRAIATAEGEG